MQTWRTIGILATLVIVLSLPFYIIKEQKRAAPLQEEAAATFVTSESCVKCHKKEYEQWQKSHHAKAMGVANKESVLGDFNDAVFENKGIRSRFYQKDGRYFVHTRGPKGVMADYEITHTFGWYPLQQYLIPFPGGRMQCLPIAWDSRDNKWFHLYPDLELDPEEWIYWTNQGQNWNSMCADCHSTRLQKNFDSASNSYDTRWAEISVGCEACHGPGSKHVAWGELPEAARLIKDDGLAVATSGVSSKRQVELCAPCHARRSMLGDYTHDQQELLDIAVPRLFDERLYHSDGQILDEVYVYGSFVQSKMYANDVRCSDCHNVHTIELHHKGNKLCLQCHQAAVYDSKSHHFHKSAVDKGEPIRTAAGDVLFEVGSGSECVGCHMGGRNYMVNDYRPDHSIRIPRPDLSVELGTPNGCNRCHIDKSSEWSAEQTRKWYGLKQKYHYGTTLQAARNGEPAARPELIRLVADSLSPVLVRATALSLLGRTSDDEVLTIFKQNLLSDEPLLRRTGLVALPPLPPEELERVVVPLLGDPVKGVRIEAARALTALPAGLLSGKSRDLYEKVLAEFEKTALYSADFAASRLNLGALYSRLGQLARAEEHFKKAVAIDRDYHAARSNLAVIYSRQGKNDLAKEQLRKALAVNPQLPDVHYSLGLLLSEQKQYREAADHLKSAAEGMVNHARVHYNLAQLLVFLGDADGAAKAFGRLIEIEPDNLQYLQETAKFYLTRQQLARAKDIGQRILVVSPDSPFGLELLRFIGDQERKKIAAPADSMEKK
ncbi:MAG: tetratricopeptide repeat protein [Thermodesulfobacteriota bacterium]